MTITGFEATSILHSSRRMTDFHVGGNSRVVRVEMGGSAYAVKDYSRRSDGRARLEREWLALEFLSTRLPGLVSQPVWRGESAPVAIHSWLPGTQPELNGDAVGAMLTWMEDLQRLSGAAADAGCPAAVDSVASAADAVGQVHARCDELNGSVAAGADPWFRSRIATVLAELDVIISTGRSAPSGVDNPSGVVVTLSPSDFGPHNLLYDGSTGTYRLVDLEFFGIDDAHKLVCDTVLHPQNSWSAPLLEHFVDGAHAALGTNNARLERLLPAISLKWAVIVLARIARESPSTHSAHGGDAGGSHASVLVDHYLRLARSVRLGDAFGLVCNSSSSPAHPSEATT